MPKQFFKVEGLKELDAALLGLAEEFKPSNARSVMRGALKDGGQVIADAAKMLAPDDPNTGGDRDLKTNIVVASSTSRSSREEKQSALEVYVGPTVKAFHGLFQEFGTARHAAHPFLRPAFDSNWRTALNTIVERTKERLEATRKRLVRKAEREAAKLKF